VLSCSSFAVDILLTLSPIVRRRFLRQNRDIARINSAQSLKIRGLENECARLLSENLDLRGQILRLEKEAERNSAQRIADHALEIKAKMEAQLEEWGLMLSGLGVEPPSKRRSFEKRKSPKSRSSTSRSPPKRRARDTTIDPETLAAQEGRLPPIHEYKAYPRITMSSEQILALCSEAADSSGNSPDLGPPPVSRYVEEDPVKIDSPSPKTTDTKPEAQTDDNNEELEDNRYTPRRLDYGKKLLSKPDLSPEVVTVAMPKTRSTDLEDEVNPMPQGAPVPISTPMATAKMGAKRKYRDENENVRTAKSQGGKENGVPLQNRRTIKEIPSSRREKAGQPKAGIMTTRTPLSAKSTNDDFSSPMKVSKEQVPAEIKTAKPQASKESLPKEKPSTQERTTRIEIASREPLPEVAIIPEPDTPFSPAMVSPDTPVRSAQMVHDTPPPSDIDSNGEAIRPSRRARSSVSYAEPSLRVKMRRPTKELFDAVSGEGKFIQRAVPQKSDGSTLVPTPVTKGKAEPEAGESSYHRRQSTMSPLAQKQLSPDILPDSVVSDRRRRPSTAVGNNLPPNEDEEQPKAKHNPPRPKSVNPIDIYDFATSSPTSESKQPEEPTKAAPKPRNPRRSSAAVPSASSSRHVEDLPEVISASSKSRSSHPRKRASMLAPKKTSVAELLNLDDGETADEDTSIDSSAGAEKVAVRDKVTRRRSMML